MEFVTSLSTPSGPPDGPATVKGGIIVAADIVLKTVPGPVRDAGDNTATVIKVIYIVAEVKWVTLWEGTGLSVDITAVGTDTAPVGEP